MTVIITCKPYLPYIQCQLTEKKSLLGGLHVWCFASHDQYLFLTCTSTCGFCGRCVWRSPCSRRSWTPRSVCQWLGLRIWHTRWPPPGVPWRSCWCSRSVRSLTYENSERGQLWLSHQAGFYTKMLINTFNKTVITGQLNDSLKAVK